MNARVPSIGSSTQRNRASGRSSPASLAEYAVVRETFGQQGAHHLLGGAVGDGDGAVVALQLRRGAGAEIRADHRARGIGGGFGPGDDGVQVYREALGSHCVHSVLSMRSATS